jgi:dienelactone hydrolase
MPKDAILPDIAKWFQEHGITCLLYDPCGIGASDGEPRNDVSFVNPGSSPAGEPPINLHACAQIDARRQAEHLHDAVTWFKKNPLVDETKIALWGLCFGGNVTLAAAAFEYVTSSPSLSLLLSFSPLPSLASLSPDPHRLTRNPFAASESPPRSRSRP